MSEPKSGMLKEVDIREQWKHEQSDFLAWLAVEEHIGIFYLFNIEKR